MVRVAHPLPMRMLLVGMLALGQSLTDDSVAGWDAGASDAMCKLVQPWHMVLLAAGHGVLALVPAGIQTESATRFVERLCYTAALRSALLFAIAIWWLREDARLGPQLWVMAAHDTVCFVWDMHRALRRVPGGGWTRVCLLLFAMVTAPWVAVRCGIAPAPLQQAPFVRANLVALLFTDVSGTVCEWCLPT